MKNKSISYALMLGVLILMTGCGADFDIDASTLETYATEHEADYADLSDDFDDTPYVNGTYVIESGGIHVEMWEFDNKSHAQSWFTENVGDYKDSAEYSAGTNLVNSGNYIIRKDDTSYRILFSDNVGIFARGDSTDDVNAVLIDLNVIDE